MMDAPGLTIPRNRSDIDEAFIQTSYTIATEYLKECYSFIFKAGDGVVCNYTIGTWSSKIKRSEVLRHGTEADISRLPPVNAHNKPHARKRSFAVVRSESRKRACRGSKKVDRLRLDDEQILMGFEDAFGGNALE